jgi:hypothetical protein
LSRRLGLLPLAALVVAGCGHSGAKTQLRITAVDSLAHAHVFHLRCEPTGGDIPNPDAACAAIGAKPRLTRDAPDASSCWSSRGPTIRVVGVDSGREVSATFTCARATRRQQWLRLLRFEDLSPEVAAIRICCQSERPPTCRPRPPRIVLDAARRLRENSLAPTRAAFWVRSHEPLIERVISGNTGLKRGPAVAVLAIGRFRVAFSCPSGNSPCPTSAAMVDSIFDARSGGLLETGGGGTSVQDVSVVPDLNRLGPVHDLLPYITGACPAT